MVLEQKEIANMNWLQKELKETPPTPTPWHLLQRFDAAG